MRKHLPIIALSAFAVVLVGITAVKAYSAMQTIYVTGDVRLETPPDSIVVQGNLVSSAPDASLGAVIYTGDAFDVVGSRTGTSVTYEYFDRLGNGTTTYPIALDPIADGGVFTVRVSGTTTHEIAYFSVMMSQDSQCDTATTSPDVGNPVLKGDINWFDAGPYLANNTGASSDTNTGTTTFAIDHSVQSPLGKVIPFTGLNARCLLLEVNASSTDLWVQFKQNSKP